MFLLKTSVVAILLLRILLVLSSPSSTVVASRNGGVVVVADAAADQRGTPPASLSSYHTNEIVAWSDVDDYYPPTFAATTTPIIKVSDPSKLQYIQVNTQAILHEVKRQLGMTMTAMTTRTMTTAGQVTNNSYLRTPSTSKIGNGEKEKEEEEGPSSTLVVFPLPTYVDGRRRVNVTCEFTKSYNMPSTLQDKFRTLIETTGICDGGVTASFVFLVLNDNTNGDNEDNDVDGSSMSSISMSGTLYLPNGVTLYMDPIIKEETSNNNNIYALYDRTYVIHEDGSKLLPTEYILPGTTTTSNDDRTITIINFPILCDEAELITRKTTTFQQQKSVLKVAFVATNSFSKLFINNVQNRATAAAKTTTTTVATNNKAVILMPMVTLLERMNGYYQHEFGISFQLISNNDKLICSEKGTATTTGGILSNDTNEPIGCGDMVLSSSFLSLNEYDYKYENNNYILDDQVETFLTSNGVNRMEYDMIQALVFMTNTSGGGATVNAKAVGPKLCNSNDEGSVSRRLQNQPSVGPSVSMEPTGRPTRTPSELPSVSMEPTGPPTRAPSELPTSAPSCSMTPSTSPTIAGAKGKGGKGGKRVKGGGCNIECNGGNAPAKCKKKIKNNVSSSGSRKVMSGGGTSSKNGSSKRDTTSSTNNNIEEPEIEGPVWYNNGGIVYTGVSGEAFMYKRVEASGGNHAAISSRGWDYYHWLGKGGVTMLLSLMLVYWTL